MIKYADRIYDYDIELINDSTVRKTARCSQEDTFLFMGNLLHHFINNPDPLVVPIYNTKVISSDQSNYNYSYTYDMMRLGVISKTEKDIINEIGFLWDYHKKEAYNNIYNSKQVDFLLENQKVYPKLFAFLKQVVEQNRYHDLHGGNIMLDLNEDYRLIDLEGFTNSPIDNNWITKYDLKQLGWAGTRFAGSHRVCPANNKEVDSSVG